MLLPCCVLRRTPVCLALLDFNVFPLSLQRFNGRMAMLGFAGIALAELQTGVPAAEQFANDVAGVSLLAVALTFASIFPKFVSGCSLKVRRWPGKHLPWQPMVVQQPCSDDVDAE